MQNEAIVYYPSHKLFVDFMFSTFGQWLRQRQNEKDISNAEIARRTKLSPTYIGNLVRDYSPNTKSGKGVPSRAAAIKIAKALGSDVDEALHAAGYSSANDVSTSISIREDVQLILNRRDVSPEDQEEYDRAVKLAVAMAEQRIEEKNKQKAS